MYWIHVIAFGPVIAEDSRRKKAKTEKGWKGQRSTGVGVEDKANSDLWLWEVYARLL